MLLYVFEPVVTWVHHTQNRKIYRNVEYVVALATDRKFRKTSSPPLFFSITSNAHQNDTFLGFNYKTCCKSGILKQNFLVMLDVLPSIQIK